jgi:putative tryptophan/tyrosine transport system substrate-binding protein
MRRREFIGLAGVVLAWPIAAGAQSTSPVIGFLSGTIADSYKPFTAAFRQGLRQAGFVEGENVAIEFRWADNDIKRLPGMAAELVGRNVNVLVAAGGNSSPPVAKAATSTIPIVFLSGGDPVKEGLVKSLNRPGGNLTGVSIFAATLEEKRLELLRELLGKPATIVFLTNQINRIADDEVSALNDAAGKLGLKVIVQNVPTDRELEAAFTTMAQHQAGAVLLQSNPFFNSHLDQVVALAGRHKLPVIYGRKEFVTAGGLFSYGPSLSESYRQLGVYAGRVLKGEKPGDLPVVQPTRFELALNLKTAKALGLEMPTSLLLRADEVIE